MTTVAYLPLLARASVVCFTKAIDLPPATISSSRVVSSTGSGKIPDFSSCKIFLLSLCYRATLPDWIVGEHQIRRQLVVTGVPLVAVTFPELVFDWVIMTILPVPITTSPLPLLFTELLLPIETWALFRCFTKPVAWPPATKLS
jgi:hypothetical protein